MFLQKIILFLIALSPICCTSTEPSREVAWARIIAIEPSPSTSTVKRFPSPLAPVTRGQFKNSILFHIHPDSPVNREAWIKSGFMSRESPPTRSFFSLLTPKQPTKTDFKELKAKKPPASFRRRTQQQNVVSRRIPKLEDPVDEFKLPERNDRLGGNGFSSRGINTFATEPYTWLKDPLTSARLPTAPIIFSPFPASSTLQQPKGQTFPQQKCFMQIPYSRPILPLPLIHYLVPTSWNPQFVLPPSNYNHADLNADNSKRITAVTPTTQSPVTQTGAPTEDFNRSDLIVNQTKAGNEDNMMESTIHNLSKEASTPVLEVKSTQQSGKSPGPQIIDVEFREDAVPQMNTKHELSTSTTATTASSSNHDGNPNPETSTEETRDLNKLAVVPVEAIRTESDGKNPATESGESLLSPSQNDPVSTRATIIETTSRE